MGQKDLAAKQFERSPEVFADIMNALIFEGEQIVSPKDLQPAPTESIYLANSGVLRNQYNDVSKYEIRNGRIVMQYTLENQSGRDYKILLRKAGYEERYTDSSMMAKILIRRLRLCCIGVRQRGIPARICFIFFAGKRFIGWLGNTLIMSACTCIR